MNNADLHTYAHLALQQIGEVTLAETFSIRWNPRMRSAAGRAKLSTLSVEMNPKLLSISVEEVHRTVLHELAHLVAWKRDGDRGHGRAWRQACADLGIPNEKATHTLPLPVRRQKRRWLYKCKNCQKSFERVKQTKNPVACAYCCKKYNRGRFTTRYLLEEIPLVLHKK